MSGMTVTAKVHFAAGKRSKKELKTGVEKAPAAGRMPRIAKLMALAIRFEGLIRDGVVADYADLARLGHVTRARMTQIMNLLHLAPDIQEAILYLSPTETGKDRITERQLRNVAAETDWPKQRRKGRLLITMLKPV